MIIATTFESSYRSYLYPEAPAIIHCRQRTQCLKSLTISTIWSPYRLVKTTVPPLRHAAPHCHIRFMWLHLDWPIKGPTVTTVHCGQKTKTFEKSQNSYLWLLIATVSCDQNTQHLKGHNNCLHYTASALDKWHTRNMISMPLDPLHTMNSKTSALLLLLLSLLL